MSSRNWHISHQDAWESRSKRKEEEGVCSGCGAEIFLLFLLDNLQFPTSGTTFSQKPRLIRLEVALLYARHKHGFHGNISGGGC